jgi:O-antigen/teichoic acid export membrane protein
MAYSGYGVWSLAVQVVTNQFLANVLLYFFYRQRIYMHFSIHSIKELWDVGSRMFFNGLLDTLFINADSLIIGKVLNTSTLGYYHRAKSLENFSIRYTSSTLASVLLPGLSALQYDTEKLKHAVLKVFHILSFISFFLCGLLLVTGREIIILLFSAKWEPAVIIFQIIIAGAFATQIFSIFYNTLISTGNVHKYFMINAASKTMMFIDFGALIVWGLYVYLILFSIVRFITFCMAMFSVSRLLNLGDYLYRKTLKYLFVYGCSVGLIFLIRFIHPYNNFYASFISTALCFICIFLFLSWVVRCEGMSILKTELVGSFCNSILDK